MKLHDKMLAELREKEIFDQAQGYAFEYIDQLDNIDVYPSVENLSKLKAFDEDLSDDYESCIHDDEMEEENKEPNTAENSPDNGPNMINEL